jgi:hypothetical protein
MKRLPMILACALVGIMALAACGGDSGAGGGQAAGGQAGGTTGQATGIKDAALLGKWISADGGSAYDFKDDFSVVVTNVGAQYNSTYNITEGGNGAGKITIGEEGGKSATWDYKITDNRLEMTTPEGRSRRMTKTQ